MRRLVWLLVAVCLLLTGCSEPSSQYSMLNIDLSTEENLHGTLMTSSGEVIGPVSDVQAVYAQVQAWTAEARKLQSRSNAEDATRLYFYPDEKQDFREQFFVFTTEDRVFVSYTPFHNHMEYYQLKEGAYEAIKNSVAQ